MSRIEKMIDIHAPIETCYKALLHFEQYPEFMPDIQSIQHKGSPNVWHWRVNSPSGNHLEWDIEVQGAKHQHHTVSWHTVRDADVAHSGALTLHAANENQTRLQLVVEYKVYMAVNPAEKQVEQRIERCLEALKTYTEQGTEFRKTTTAETWDKM